MGKQDDKNASRPVRELRMKPQELKFYLESKIYKVQFRF